MLRGYFWPGCHPSSRSISAPAAGRWLENSIRHLLGEAKSRRPGGAVVLSKMAEAFFIETLRRYMQQLPPEQRGRLAGARDPVIGAALAVLHRQPCRSWTLFELAAEIDASRSLVAERFVLFLGEPPLTYLLRWRLQLAARLLQTTQKTILQVAVDVEYESEAAFNRAFRHDFGLPPAQYRRKLAGNGAGVRITSAESPSGRSSIATRDEPPAAGLS
jgi:AraC-like DNA-binding protein